MRLVIISRLLRLRRETLLKSMDLLARLMKNFPWVLMVSVSMLIGWRVMLFRVIRLTLVTCFMLTFSPRRLVVWRPVARTSTGCRRGWRPLVLVMIIVQGLMKFYW